MKKHSKTTLQMQQTPQTIMKERPVNLEGNALGKWWTKSLINVVLKILFFIIFRQNPRHRLDMAHPGDVDYIVPDMPEPNVDAPKCKYGRKCYRLNPEHFKNFEHPRNSE